MRPFRLSILQNFRAFDLLPKEPDPTTLSTKTGQTVRVRAHTFVHVET